MPQSDFAADFILPVQNDLTLTERVVEQLRDMIVEQRLRPGSQLPSEPELAAMLNVSRTTLRSALVHLAREGFIVRRRGVGTFVADKPPVANNLNVNEGVTDLIRAMGATPGIIELQVTVEPAGDRIAHHLDIAEGMAVVVVERVRTADDRRVVLSRDFMALERVEAAWPHFSIGALASFLEEHQSLYAVVNRQLRLQVQHGFAWLRPVIASNAVAKKLEVNAGTALLYIEQVDYTLGGKPLLLSDEYYLAEAYTFTVYRE